MKRVLNFSAGPSAIPLEVLEEAKENLLDFHGNGMSIMEGSHRAKMYDDVHNEAISLLRENYKIPDDFDVLFVQGGASMQFAMIPMNLKVHGRVDFVDTGVWSAKAIKEAKIQGFSVNVVASSEETNYDHIPEIIVFNRGSDYAYITSNNTIYGTEYQTLPKADIPLVVDASSDFASSEVDWNNVDLLYAGAQKNAGPAGVTVVIIRKSLLERASDSVPSMLKYKNYALKNSMYNTPPTFSIYLLSLSMKWLKNQGGISAIRKINEQKAKLLYDSIDASDGFYLGHAKKSSRSLMNVSFNIKTKALEEKFLSECAKRDMVGLKGHRSLGGLRASIYNAVSLENVQALKEFMDEFAKKNA